MDDPSKTTEKPISDIATSEAVGAAMGEFGRLTDREIAIARYSAKSAARWMKRLLVTQLDNMEV